MTYTLDDLRALVRDDDQVVFSDSQLDIAMAASPNNILRAAGIMFRTLAAEYALSGKSVKTDDLAIDIRQRGADLNAIAGSFFTDALQLDKIAASENTQIVPFGGRNWSDHTSDRWVVHYW